MFKKVVLPVDLTDRHQAALNIAAGLVPKEGGEIILLHVIEVIPGLSMEEERSFYDRLEKLAQEHLSKLGQWCDERGVPWRSMIRYGHRAPEIAHCARELSADLIVVTAPHMTAEHPTTGWGSLSWKIGVLGPCPVLLVK